MSLKRAVPGILMFFAAALPGYAGAKSVYYVPTPLAAVCQANITWSLTVDSVEEDGTMLGRVDVVSADPASELRWFVQVFRSGGFFESEPLAGSGSVNVSVPPGQYVILREEERTSSPEATCIGTELRYTLHRGPLVEETYVMFRKTSYMLPTGVGVTKGHR